MKLRLQIVLGFVFALLIMGCNSKQKENDLTKNDIKGDVKSIIEERHSATVRFGEIEKETRKSYYEVDFNEDGNLKVISSYDSDGSVDGKRTFEYDEEGNKVEEIEYNSDGSIDYKYTYEYDEEGNLEEEIRYDSDGSIFGKDKFEYDEEGNKVEEIEYNSDGSIL